MQEIHIRIDALMSVPFSARRLHLSPATIRCVLRRYLATWRHFMHTTGVYSSLIIRRSIQKMGGNRVFMLTIAFQNIPS